MKPFSHVFNYVRAFTAVIVMVAATSQIVQAKAPVHEPTKVPADALRLARQYYSAHRKEFANDRYLSIIDYTKSSSAQRFYVIDLRTQAVESLLVAHGRGSDPRHTGNCEAFADTAGSLKTSLGFFKTGATYQGSHGLSLRLIGLSATNKNAEARSIVIHGAPYVSEGRKVLGRSWGCPAVSPKAIGPLIEKIKGGSLLLAWHQKFSK